MNIKDQDDLIKILEETHEKLIDAEEAMDNVIELCKSYFLHDYRTEASTMRINSIIKVINTYYDKHKKGDQDGDTGLQSESK